MQYYVNFLLVLQVNCTICTECYIPSSFLEQFPADHPVQVYLEENILLRSLFSQIEQLNPKTDFAAYKQLFAQIRRVEFHYLRKENQLFPKLEQHGWNSPSKNIIRREVRFILIRYFAVRDNDSTYRGVMEMSQDITDIQTMEGEQRLLDWD